MKSNLGWLIKKANTSQDKIAKALKVSPPTISNWARNNTYPDARQMVALTKLLGCTLNDLYEIGKGDEELNKRVFDVVTQEGKEFNGVYFIQYNEKVLISQSTREFGEVVKEIKAFNLEGEEQSINLDGLAVKRWYDSETGEEFDMSTLYESKDFAPGKYVYPLADSVWLVGGNIED